MLIERHRKKANDRDAQQNAGSDLAVHEWGAGVQFKVAARGTVTEFIDGRRRVLEQSRRSPGDSLTFDYELNATTNVVLIMWASVAVRSGLFRRVDPQTEKTGQGIGKNPKKLAGVRTVDHCLY
jgi:hypothetical protein